MPAKFKPCPQCKRLMTADAICPHCPAPFGNVAFDPSRKPEEDSPTNGDRAERFKIILACYVAFTDHSCSTSKGRELLAEIASHVDLNQEPEIPLGDLLADAMHYCHREEINWFGKDGVSQDALRNFSAESEGAVL
jgi:hypothetical protein